MISRLYNRVMDWIANYIFPPPHPMLKIAGCEIDSVDMALAIYTLVGGIGLWLLFDNWLWLVAVPLTMVMAWFVHKMLWGD
jgi:hypothetical protein